MTKFSASRFNILLNKFIVAFWLDTVFNLQQVLLQQLLQRRGFGWTKKLLQLQTGFNFSCSYFFLIFAFCFFVAVGLDNRLKPLPF